MFGARASLLEGTAWPSTNRVQVEASRKITENGPELPGEMK